jgi:hypothetical protein
MGPEDNEGTQFNVWVVWKMLTPSSTSESSSFVIIWATWGQAFSSNVMISVISMPGCPVFMATLTSQRISE